MITELTHEEVLEAAHDLAIALFNDIPEEYNIPFSVALAEFDEEKHPRDEAGKFTKKHTRATETAHEHTNTVYESYEPGHTLEKQLHEIVNKSANIEEHNTHEARHKAHAEVAELHKDFAEWHKARIEKEGHPHPRLHTLHTKAQAAHTRAAKLYGGEKPTKEKKSKTPEKQELSKPETPPKTGTLIKLSEFAKENPEVIDTLVSYITKVPENERTPNALIPLIIDGSTGKVIKSGIVSRSLSVIKNNPAIVRTLIHVVTQNPAVIGDIIGGIAKIIKSLRKPKAATPPKETPQKIVPHELKDAEEDYKPKGLVNWLFTKKEEQEDEETKEMLKDAEEDVKPTPKTHKSRLKVKETTERAYNGKQVKTTNKLTKIQTRRLGENIIVALLQEEGSKDARPMNYGHADYPIDLIHDHETVEVKTGLISNAQKSQHWRSTIGTPGKAERALLATLDGNGKREWNRKKQAAIVRRKEAALKKVSEELGHEVKAKTYTLIINPDTKIADIYEFDGLHERTGWNSPEAEGAYKKSVKYE